MSISILCAQIAATSANGGTWAVPDSNIGMQTVHERTLRRRVTTQVEIHRKSWEADTICLWLPESVYADFDARLWCNHDEKNAQQYFGVTEEGITWTFESRACQITCTAMGEKDSLHLICAVANLTDSTMPNVYAQNCLHFPKAPAFSGPAGEQVYFRENGDWRSMADTEHWFARSGGLVDATKFCFRKKTLLRGRYGHIRRQRNVAPEHSDHPLIIAESADRERAVAVAGQDWDFVFHNTSPMFRCIHSQPLPVALEPMQQVTFRQRIYFSDHGRHGLVEKFEEEARALGNTCAEVSSFNSTVS